MSTHTSHHADLTLLDRVPVMATLLVTMAAGTLAAVATRDVAVRTGAVEDAWLAWLLPLIVEGGAATAGLLAWARARAGERARPERLALGVLLTLATVVNASHAAGGPVLGVVLAACPPLIVVASVEMLLRAHAAREKALAAEEAERVKVERTRAAQEERARAQAERQRARTTAQSERDARVPSAQEGHGRVQSDARGVSEQPVTTSSRDAVVAQMLAENLALTGAQVGERLGVSASQGRRLLAKARGGSADPDAPQTDAA